MLSLLLLDQDYRRSLDNIIQSMEEELNFYYTELKAITLEKLLKNFEIIEVELPQEYFNKTIEGIVRDVL